MQSTVHSLALDSLYQATGTTTHIDLISAMTKLGISPSPQELQVLVLQITAICTQKTQFSSIEFIAKGTSCYV